METKQAAYRRPKVCKHHSSRDPRSSRQPTNILAHTHARARANTHTQTHRCKSMDANTRARVHTHMLMRTALYAYKREHTCVQTNLISRMV